MEQIKPQRRYDLDWLRVLLVFCVFLFHCGAFFTSWHWHLKNETLSPGMSLFGGFLLLWMLPSIFIVSAAGIWYSLEYQSPLKFIRGKVLRLFVPLVFDVFILSPHQQYFDRLTKGISPDLFSSFCRITSRALTPWAATLRGMGSTSGTFCGCSFSVCFFFHCFCC